jgi:hypothetical protein
MHDAAPSGCSLAWKAEARLREATRCLITTAPERGSSSAGRLETFSRGNALYESEVSSTPMIWAARASLAAMPRDFDAQLRKGDNPGAWTCVIVDNVPEMFGTRGLVKIRGAIDGTPFEGALMPQGDGTHRLPVKAKLRTAIGKQVGDTVQVRIDGRIT